MSQAPAQPVRRRREPLRTAFVVALLASLCVHVATMLGSLTFGGAPRAGGEGGTHGAGGVTMDITIAGPATPPLPAQTEPEPAQTEPPEAERPESARTEPAQTAPAQAAPARAAAPREALRAPESPVALATGAPAAATPTPAGAPPERATEAAAGGTGAAQTSGGRAAGEDVRRLILGSAGLLPTSVEGQRALLPAATTCDDPIAGLWRALQYSPALGGQWVRFTLRIERGEGDAVRGTIRSRIWHGTPSDRTPPPCAPGQYDTTHAMVANGRVEGTAITFGARTHRLVADHCPQLFGVTHDYAPDHFSGTIDAMRQEFQSVNNDGAYDINTPYVFRRIGCLDVRRESADEGDSAP